MGSAETLADSWPQLQDAVRVSIGAPGEGVCGVTGWALQAEGQPSAALAREGNGEVAVRLGIRHSHLLELLYRLCTHAVTGNLAIPDLALLRSQHLARLLRDDSLRSRKQPYGRVSPTCTTANDAFAAS
jgi:hypothetical protein